MVRLIRNFAFVLLCVSSFSSFGAVTVSVFPDKPNIAESFRLVFVADEKINGEPDFSPLDDLFEVLGRNQSTQVQWINGKHSATTKWELEVIAKKPGDLVIPAIEFGSSSSQPTSITVVASGAGGTTDNDDLLLEITVDDEAPYVQQQVILTVRLLRRISLSDAKMTEPATSGDVIIKPLNKDRTYQDQRNGKRYEVFERRFALFPQASGALEISPITVTTQVARGSRSLFDPFRPSTSTRRVRSNALALEVRPIPSEFTGATWLPARQLKLREEWEPGSGVLNNGEPATRTLYLTATGLSAGQLPDFPALEIPNVTVYPDQVQSREQDSGDAFTSLKQQKFAIITKFDAAASAAEIQFPAIEIPWWNIETDQMEVARLASRRLKVDISNPPQEAVADTSPAIELQADEQSELQTLPVGASSEDAGFWKPVAILALCGWFITAGLWFWKFRPARHVKRGENTPEQNPKLSRLEKNVLHAARSNDPYASRQSLIAWGRFVFGAEDILSLGRVASLASEELATELRQLDAHFYAQSSALWHGENLIKAFKNNKITTEHRAGAKPPKEALTSLFKLA